MFHLIFSELYLNETYRQVVKVRSNLQKKKAKLKKNYILKIEYIIWH